MNNPKPTYEELEKQVARLKNITDNIFDMVATADMEGEFTFVGGSHRQLGYEPEELVGRNVAELAHPHDKERIIHELSLLIQTKTPKNTEYRYRKKDGTYTWLHTHGNIVFDESDKSSYLLFSSRDISERKQAENALAKSEKRYNLAMLAINDGLWDWNLKTGKVFFDERYFTMAGYSPNEFTHEFDEWKTRVHPDDYPAAMSSIEDHLANKIDKFDIEFRFKRKNGQWMWIRGRGKGVEKDDDGNITRFIGSHTDITQQKEVEQKLIESNKRYTTVLENLLEGVFVLQSDNVVFANKAVMQITGYNLGEMKNRPFLDAVFDEDRERVYKIYKRRLEGETIPPYDIRILSKIGKVRWFMLSSIKIKWEGKDAVLVFAQDIHDRKLAEDKLRESEERLSLITNSVDSVIFSLKPEGDEFRIDFINDYFFKDTGYKKEDFVGKLLSEVIPPDKYETMVHKYREAVDKQQNVTWEENSPWKEGMQNAIVSITPVYNQKSQCTYVLGTMSDITERVKAENALKTSEKELKNLNATKDRLFSIIGHDLRNPLNNMFGFAFLLQRRAAQYHDEKLNKYIDAISQSAHSVSELLENLLEWSRAQTQEIKVEKRDFYLNEIIEANFKLFYNSAKAKKSN